MNISEMFAPALRSQTHSKRSWYLITPAVCGAIPLFGFPLSEWAAIAPRGDDIYLWLAILFVFPALAAVLLLNIALVGLAFKRTRWISAIVALCCIAYGAGFLVGGRIGKKVRMHAFVRLAERSKPLIGAIHAYEAKHARPPESLDALVPEYFKAVPSTQMRAYPEYRYEHGSNCYGGNSWTLSVSTPSGGINFDQFLYLPLTNYPQRGFGGWLERVGDWAYVHE